MPRRFEMLTIGAARTQHDDAQVTLSGERIEVGDAGRRQDNQLLAEEGFDPEAGMVDRSADEGAVETMLHGLLDQLVRGAGAQRQIDGRVSRDELGKHRRQA
jgi:hypothetical protein